MSITATTVMCCCMRIVPALGISAAPAFPNAGRFDLASARREAGGRARLHACDRGVIDRRCVEQARRDELIEVALLALGRAERAEMLPALIVEADPRPQQRRLDR